MGRTVKSLLAVAMGLCAIGFLAFVLLKLESMKMSELPAFPPDPLVTESGDFPEVQEPTRAKNAVAHLPGSTSSPGQTTAASKPKPSRSIAASLRLAETQSVKPASGDSTPGATISTDGPASDPAEPAESQPLPEPTP